jgi:hypothetical protein
VAPEATGYIAAIGLDLVGQLESVASTPSGPTGRWGREASFRAECLAKKPYGAKALALVTCEELASLDRVHYRERLKIG